MYSDMNRTIEKGNSSAAAFSRLIGCLGEPIVRQLFNEAHRAMRDGYDGLFISYFGCCDDTDTVDIAVRTEQIDFRLGPNGYTLPVSEAEALLPRSEDDKAQS